MDRKYLIYILLPITVALLIIFWFFRKDIQLPVNNEQNIVATTTSYTNNEFGFSFKYPTNYEILEKDIDIVYRNHKSIILMPAGYIPPEGGEGPTTISLDIYQNNLEKLSIERWIKENSFSNYKLSPEGKLISMTIDGLDALTYNWDGLYRGQTIVFEYQDNIYALSVTHMTSQDKILKDFDIVYNSFHFINKNSEYKLISTRVENYLKENISIVSPEKEVLGGKFYITDLKLNNDNNGIVSYEDGHVAFVADFTYTVANDGGVTIDSFVIRK